MRQYIYVIFIAALLLNLSCRSEPSDLAEAARSKHVKLIRQGRLKIQEFTKLQDAVDAALNGDRIEFTGMQNITAENHQETACANCLDIDPKNPDMQTTRGLKIINKNIILEGKETTAAGSIIKTNAGYGVFIENSKVTFKNLTITGGIRSPSKHATDGAVVVFNSTVSLDKVRVINNNSRLKDKDGKPMHPGLIGVAGRTGAVITIKDSLIENNSWDGFVLYDNAKGEISDSIVRKGNGVGIAATWNSEMKAIRNTVDSYWKGIGSFGDAKVEAYNNLVKNQSGWGIVASSKQSMKIVNNTIVNSGNCGLVMWNKNSKGEATNNIVYSNGDKETWVCPRAGIIWNENQLKNPAIANNWKITYNVSFNAKDAENFVSWDFIEKTKNVKSLLTKAVSLKNQTIDPGFAKDGLYQLPENSPLLHAGDPSLKNPDGTASHPGIYGGPHAWIN